MKTFIRFDQRKPVDLSGNFEKKKPFLTESRTFHTDYTEQEDIGNNLLAKSLTTAVSL